MRGPRNYGNIWQIQRSCNHLSLLSTKTAILLYSCKMNIQKTQHEVSKFLDIYYSFGFLFHFVILDGSKWVVVLQGKGISSRCSSPRLLSIWSLASIRLCFSCLKLELVRFEEVILGKSLKIHSRLWMGNIK